MKQADKLRIEEAIRKIDYLQDIKKSEFLTDPIVRAAALRCLKAIGEAVAYYETNSETSFSQEIISKYPQITFTQVARLRHDLTHHYFFLFHDNFREGLLTKINSIIFNDIHTLKEQLQIILKIECSEASDIKKPPEIPMSKTPLFLSVLPDNPHPLISEEAVPLPKGKHTLTGETTKTITRPQLTSADYLSIALLEIQNLMGLCKTLNSSLKEKMMESHFFRFAIENHIENIIQAIKDSQDTRLLDKNDNKTQLIMRCVVTNSFASSKPELSLFYSDFTHVRSERIAHNSISNYFSEKDVEQKQAHIFSLLEFINKIFEFIEPIKECISKLSEGYMLKAGPIVPRFVWTLSSKTFSNLETRESDSGQQTPKSKTFG